MRSENEREDFLRVRVGSFGEAATAAASGGGGAVGTACAWTATSGTLGPSRVFVADAGRRWRSDMKLREMPSTVRRRDRDLGCTGASSVGRFEFDDTASCAHGSWTRIAGVSVLDRVNLRLRRFLSEGDRGGDGGGDGGSEEVCAAGGEGGGGGACWRAAGSCLRNSKGAGTVASACACCGSGTLLVLFTLFERVSDLLRTRMVRR